MGHPVFLNKDHLLTFTYITTITNTISVISTIITITNTFISVISTIIVTNTTITNTVLSAPSSSPSPPSLTPSSVLSAPSSSPPVYLVPRSRFGGSRRKKGGGGRGRGEEETRSGKIRLRGPESGPRVNCACSKSDLFSSVQYKHRVRYRVAFCFKKRGSLNLRLKPKHLDVLKAEVQQIDLF